MALYVVTGGAGFIGSHLVDALLARGDSVRVLDDLSTGRVCHLDPRATFTEADVTDPAAVAAVMQGAAGCFHLAAIASVARCTADWREAHRTNLGGTVTVLEAAREAGRMPVVYASSAAVYGDVGGARAREDIPPHPLSAYGADKLGAELHGRVAFSVHATPTLGLRFFNVYGPRQDPSSPYSGVISIFSRLVQQRKSLTIDGDGLQTRDFICVDDVVAHLLAGMDRLQRHPSAEVLNVCTGIGTTVRELADILGDLVGWRPEIGFLPARVGDIRASLGDPTRARAALATPPAVKLRAGLEKLLSAQPLLRIAG